MARNVPEGRSPGDSQSYKTPLAQAIMSDDAGTVQTLLLSGADINEFSYFRGHGEAPLLTAVRYARNNLVQLLLKHGANVNLESSRGHTPLLRATQRNYFNMMSWLLEQGANPNATDTSGRGTLFWAVKLRNLSAVRELLKYRASVNLLSSNDQTTLLHVAVTVDYRSVIEVLLRAGAKVNAKDAFGETPLFCAVRVDSFKVVKLLLDNGAHINVVNQDQRTPLHISAASVSGDCFMMELLLYKGANVNALDRYHNSPLVLSLRNYVLRPISPVARSLIRHGSNLRDPNCAAALGWMIESNSNYDVVQYAVEAGLRLSSIKWVTDLMHADPEQLEWGFTARPDHRKKEFVEYLKKRTRTLQSLSFFCRRTIRECVMDSGKYGSVCLAIGQLPLPEALLSFLLLHDVDEDLDLQEYEMLMDHVDDE